MINNNNLNQDITPTMLTSPDGPSNAPRSRDMTPFGASKLSSITSPIAKHRIFTPVAVHRGGGKPRQDDNPSWLNSGNAGGDTGSQIAQEGCTPNLPILSRYGNVNQRFRLSPFFAA